MKKIIKSSHLIALIIAWCIFHISVFSQTCVNCDTLRENVSMYCHGTSGRIEFHNDNMQVMSIRADNNVYIGDGDPEKSSSLYVNGHIRANLVRVNTDTWSDYVFAPDYNLMPLHELSSFITDNGHLPDIPAEAEVLENGIDLGEMNGLLLKKIEELTLYLLEQDRKINTLQTELQQIKNSGNNN